MAPSRNLTVQIVGDTRGFDRAMVRAQGSVGKFGSSIKTAGIAVGGVAAAATGLAVSFDKSMRNVNSIAQLPEKRFAALEKQVLRLAGKTAQAPKTLADGLYDLVSSGFNAHQSMIILAKSAKAATAGLTDTATSTAAVAAVLNAYHLKAQQAGKVSDTLFQTVNRGVITFEELAQNIGDVLPFASSLGVNLQQVGASISTMTKEGISAPETMTRIKNVMVALLKPSDALKKAFKDLGVTSGEQLIHQKGFQGALEALIGTTGGSKKAVAQLFPNIRALGGALALTGGNAKTANQDLKAFGQVNGATNKALSQQAKSVSYQWQRLKAQVEAIAISYGSKLLPAVSKVIQTIGDPRLTNTQKFDRVRAQIFKTYDQVAQKIDRTFTKERFKRAEDALLQTFDQAAPKITHAIDKITPAIITAIASAAPKAASHFATAFVNAGPWSKLLIGGWLLKKMGGLPAFEAVGAQAGGAMARGAAVGGGAAAVGGRGGGVGAGTGVGAGLLAGAAAKAKGLLKTGGKLAGRFAALDLAINLVDSKGDPIRAVADSAHDLSFGIVPKPKIPTASERTNSQLAGLAKQLDDVTKRRDTGGLVDLIGKFRSMAAEAKNFHAPKVASEYDTLANKAGRSLDKLYAQERGSKSASREFAANIRGMRLSSTKDFGRLVDQVVFGSKNILRIGGGNVKLTQQAISYQFDLARRRVKQAMDKHVLAVKQGTKLLHQLAVKELGLYGIKGGKVNVVLAKGANGQLRPNQRGGFQDGGKPSGDSIPSLLERGEYVLNRNAVRKIGKDRLDQINFRHAARFQQGGGVGMGGLKPGVAAAANAVLRAFPGMMITSGFRTSMPLGHPDLHNLGEAADIAGSPGVMLKAAAWIRQHLGRSLAEGIHNPNLSIKNGQQVSPSFWGASTWAAHANHIHIAVIGALQALGLGGGNLKRPLIQGLGGVPGAAAQGAMDRIYQAANAAVAAATGAVGPGVESGSGMVATGNGAALMKQIAAQRGWNFADWWAIDAMETGHGRNLLNPSSGAFNRAQFLPSNKGKYGPGSLPGASMADQIESMAEYIAQRYGNPTKALAHEKAFHWYRKGGLVGFKKGGGLGFAETFNPKGPMGIAGGLGGTLDIVGHAKNAKLRRRALSTLVASLNKLGVLPKGMSANLAKFASNDNVYGDRADRAGQLADAGLPATVNGKTQAQWLTAELENLLKWRNAIIRAVEVINRRRAQVAKFTERAKKQLATVRKQLDRASLAKQIKAAEQNLKALQKHPKGKGKQIKAAAHLLHVLSVRNKAGRSPLLREENALTTRILPALSKQAGNLKTAHGNLLGGDGLEGIQGPGGPMKILRSLPTIGALGGSIFDVQLQLRQLAQPTTATDSTATSASTADTSATDNGRADLLATLLQQANLRYAASQAQFKALSDFPPYGGSYDTGGVVPGPTGAARTAVVHGGEGVFTPEQMQAMGGNGQPIVVQIVVQDGAVDAGRIKAIANGEAVTVVRQQSRRGGRNLPGRAGALRP